MGALLKLLKWMLAVAVVVVVWEEWSEGCGVVLDDAVEGLFKFNHSRSVGGGVKCLDWREAAERDVRIAQWGIIESTEGFDRVWSNTNRSCVKKM